MDMLRTLISRVAALFHQRKLDAELDEELREHIELAIAENLRRGMSADEARTTALREFGGITQTKERYREQRGIPALETLARDARYAVRQLRRNPGFTLTVIFTLALSIGANTAVFSIVNALLLRGLPYPHPERMGAIFARRSGSEAFEGRNWINGKQWELLRDNVPSLIGGLSGAMSNGANLQAGSSVEYIRAARISAHYLDVLGIHPAVGRNFTEEEDRPHGAKAAIVSYGLWQRALGGDRGVVGQAIRLKGEAYTVIGILPEGAPQSADVYTPLQPSPEGEGQGTNYEVITRLRDGATWQQADAEINRVWIPEFLSRHPRDSVVFHSVPLQKGATSELRPKALALMLAAGFILLIACANLAGLTLVRMMRRAPELATRLALGASHGQIRQQLWVENLLLALAGGAAGVGVGFAGLRGLLTLLPEGFLQVASVPLDGRVLMFTLAVSLTTSVLFGMLPALMARDLDLRQAMGTRTGMGTERRYLRQTLVGLEVAITVVLLAGAGLLIRTLAHLETLPPGFNPDGVMTAKASLDDARYRDPAAFRRLLEESTAALRNIPGVQNAAVGLTVPYERFLNGGVSFDDGPEAGKQAGTDMDYVTPEYFKTLEMPLVAGRYFTSSDGPDTQPVAIVNRAFAQKFFQGANPVGRSLDKGTVIVGEVADIQLASGLHPVAPLMSEQTMYLPAAQAKRGDALAVLHVWFQPSWIVRTAAPVEGLTGEMQRALARVDSGLPFSGFYSMNDLRSHSLVTQRIEVALLSAMAGLALLLSAVGIFALVANLVAQRTREIGIRMALGSSATEAMVHVGAPAVRASGVGLAAGLIVCAVALRAMRSVIYGVGVYDATTILAVVLTVALVAVLATTVPVLRIASIDPATTLRDE